MKQQLTFDQALKLHQGGQFKQAEKAYQALLKDDPQNPDLNHLLAILNGQRGTPSKGLEPMQKALNMAPEEPSYHSSMGNLLKLTSQFDKAFEHFKKALKLDPDNPSTINNLASALYQAGYLDESVKYYQRAVELKPNYADAYYNLATAIAMQGNVEQAIETFYKALAIDPEHRLSHGQLAQLLQYQGNNADAIYHFRKRLQTDPDNPTLNHQLGLALLDYGLTDKAIEHLRTTILTDPEHKEAYHNLGAIFIERGQLQAALKYYLRLAQIEAGFDCYYNLGVIYMYQDHHDDAIQYFQQALEMEPGNTAILNNLGAIYIKKGQHEKAAPYYEQVLQQQPDNSEASHLLRAIKQDSTPEFTPTTYTKNLFNQYAPYYDQHLKTYLHYKAPQQVFDAVNEQMNDPDPKWRVLDIGCGTGLSGEPFRKPAKELIGVDIAPKMIEIAQDKELYDQLYCGDLTHIMSDLYHFDVILAVDVVSYIGEIDRFLQTVHKALGPDGLLAFTTEKSLHYPYRLTRHARFAHHKDYIEKLINQNGLQLDRRDNIVLREQKRTPVEGHLFIARQPH